MRRPRIGISLTLDDRGRWRPDRAYHYIDRSYADAIDRAGGVVFQLPIQADPRALVQAIDGLLIPGGDDFPVEGDLPSDARLELVSPEQLAFDEALYAAARERRIPILGICYGMQLMARLGQGELYGHLSSQCPDADPHRLAPADRHSISIEKSSRLACILGDETAQVNSLHQQAVHRVGSGHRVVATSTDGVVEAIEGTNETADEWELGVQWHPEKMNEASSERLFRAFVEACRDTGASV